MNEVYVEHEKSKWAARGMRRLPFPFQCKFIIPRHRRKKCGLTLSVFLLKFDELMTSTEVKNKMKIFKNKYKY